MIKVSIVIPTRERPELLERCLESIRRECGMCEDPEVIVVDDGSPDTVRRRNEFIAERYCAGFSCMEKNCGVAMARNRGIELAQGEWVVFLDDDVTVDKGWHPALFSILRDLPADAIGFEGRVNPSGDGVWDREVRNISGGAFLTCHLCMRKEFLISPLCIGDDKASLSDTPTFSWLLRFDDHFATNGPYCEDHELACRSLLFGKVPFFGSISVTHAPRRMDYLRYIAKTICRMRKMLWAEHYFFSKHPDRYHRFRRHRTFAGTFISILLRNVMNDIRRRSPSVLFRHPFQCAALITASLMEQIAAWGLLPHFLFAGRDSAATFGRHIDLDRTARLWHLPQNSVDVLRVRRRIFAALSFWLLRRPVYDCRPVFRRIRRIAFRPVASVYLRIDDVFLSEADAVRRLCTLFVSRGLPFLASVTGDDLAKSGSRPLVDLIRSSGGHIGLHGFTHTGRFGPFASELLQMRLADIASGANLLHRCGAVLPGEPLVLVPPFNAIGPLQIALLSRVFRIICGGPETVRFVDGFFGPAALAEGGWYFPSLYPMYGSARSMIALRMGDILRLCTGPVCLTTHFTVEAEDSFRSLEKLLDSLPSGLQAWNQVF